DGFADRGPRRNGNGEVRHLHRPLLTQSISQAIGDRHPLRNGRLRVAREIIPPQLPAKPEFKAADAKHTSLCRNGREPTVIDQHDVFFDGVQIDAAVHADRIAHRIIVKDANSLTTTELYCFCHRIKASNFPRRLTVWSDLSVLCERSMPLSFSIRQPECRG